MKKNKQFAVLPVVILVLVIFHADWALAQSHHGRPGMEPQKGGMMQPDIMCPLDGGHGGGRMGGGMMWGGMHNAMLMHGFHIWTNRFMANADALELSRDQVEKIDQMITSHLTKVIRDQAEIQAQMVTLQKDLRAENIDLKNIEKQLQTTHNKTLQMQIEGIRLYTQVLKALTPQQRAKTLEIIGTPFPPTWERGGHGMRRPMRKQTDQ